MRALEDSTGSYYSPSYVIWSGTLILQDFCDRLTNQSAPYHRYFHLGWTLGLVFVVGQGRKVG